MMSPMCPAATASGLMMVKVRSVAMVLRSEETFNSECFLIHDLLQRSADKRGTFCDRDTGGLERRDLIRRGSFSPGNDRTGMAHATARWRRAARDEAYNWLLYMGLHKSRGFFFRQPADFANHHKAVGVWVVIEQTQSVHERRPNNRVPDH